MPGASPGAASRTAPAEGPLALRACRLPELPTEVLCGQLGRPLDPARPDGPQIRLRVAVLPALARVKLPDPVVMLAGGPGQSAVSLAAPMRQRLRALNRRRDIVLVDQRGTGESAPLYCADERHLSPEAQIDLDAGLARLAACRRALQLLPHGDLRFYTTVIASQDLDAVRVALGVQRWNLIGASYGTRAALDYQRQFPQAVRRAVLDGVAPPDMALPLSFGPDAQSAFDAVFAQCLAQPDCQAAYPDLRADWARALAALPREVQLRDPYSLRYYTVTLTREVLLGAVRAPLYVPALASALPAAIAAAAQGRFDALAALAQALGGGAPARRLALGMHHAVICSEDLPRVPAAASAQAELAPLPRDFGRIDLQRYQTACTGWPRADVPAAFYTMPPATQAVLLLSGGADPATPPRHGERAAQALGAMARHVVVPEAGHGVMTVPCMAEVVRRFIDAETDAQALAVEAGCAQAMPRPGAYRPPDPQGLARTASEATR